MLRTFTIAARYARFLFIPFALLLGSVAIGACTPQAPAPADQMTATHVATRAPAAVSTVVPSATPTPDTPTPTPTARPTSTPTDTPAPSPSPSPTAPPTETPAPTATLGPTPDGTPRTLRVPILMYHYISQPPPDADIYRKDLSVAPDRFGEHLSALKEAGYEAITLDDLLYALAQGRPLPPKPVIITFDDGYADNHTNAFPRLQEAGMAATFFVITDFVTEGRPEYMTWAQIEEMARAGQQFGSHSRNHPNLSGQSVDYLVWQALGSKEAIEARLGKDARWVAYPSGKYDTRTIQVFQSAGFWGALTTQQGAEHSLEDIFELRRIRVRGSHSAEDLLALLAIDW